MQPLQMELMKKIYIATKNNTTKLVEAYLISKVRLKYNKIKLIDDFNLNCKDKRINPISIQ